MFEQKRYYDACSKLKLRQEKMEEIIAMTEQNNKVRVHHPLRVMVLAAAMVAVLAVTASAASVGGFENLWSMFFTTYSFSVHMGGQDGTSPGFETPQFGLNEENGRTILTVEEERLDITNALEEEGQYIYRREYDEVTCTITVHADGKIDVVNYDAQGNPIMDYSISTYTATIEDIANIVELGDELEIKYVSIDQAGDISVDEDGIKTGVYHITAD